MSCMLNVLKGAIYCFFAIFSTLLHTKARATEITGTYLSLVLRLNILKTMNLPKQPALNLLVCFCSRTGSCSVAPYCDPLATSKYSENKVWYTSSGAAFKHRKQLLICS